MAKVHVSTTINGEPMEFLCEPYETMLDALRGQLGLTARRRAARPAIAAPAASPSTGASSAPA